MKANKYIIVYYENICISVNTLIYKYNCKHKHYSILKHNILYKSISYVLIIKYIFRFYRLRAKYYYRQGIIIYKTTIHIIIY